MVDPANVAQILAETPKLVDSAMSHPYDTLTAQRLRNKTCVKWHHFDDDVLPLWVADMDFPVAEPIKAAITEVLDRNDLGYPPHDGLPGLKEAALERLSARYGWQLQPEQLQALNGTVSELYLAVLACTSVGEEVIVQAPIYPPFLSAIGDAGRNVLYNQLLETPHGWEIDFDGLEKLVTPATRLLALCNPHNPSGRVFKRDELEKLADFALRHRLWVVSDELHSDLVYPGHAHLPLASCPEIGQRTLTLFGPTKTFTIAGLRISFIASRNSELLERIKTFAHGLVGAPNVLAQAAAIAAYREGGPWLEQTLSYLDGNRRFLADYLKEHLPGVGYRPPEGTYLAWLDFHKLLPADELEDFLLKEAKVGLNLGPVYGPGGEGFARLNFATSRGILTEALDRIRDAYHARLD